MQMVSAQEKADWVKRLEELYKAQVECQERIRKAAALGDITDNADYRFAKEENQSIQRDIAQITAKLGSAAVVSADDVPDGVVFLGHTVRLMDLADDTEQLVRLVGEAQQPAADSDVLPVSINSPMGEALLKVRVGETIRVKAPRGTMEFKVMEIVK